MSRLNFYGVFISSLTLFGCATSSEEEGEEKNSYVTIQGYAQGTTYDIQYFDTLNRDLSLIVDSILYVYDQQLSTYIDSSLISVFNSFEDTVCITLDSSEWWFEECFQLSKEVHEYSNGAFNPAVHPLVEYWGFSNEGNFPDEVSQLKIDSLLLLTSFSDDAVFLENDNICKVNKYISLDFNGIAQGHSVDMIGRYFEFLEIKDYKVEIGGEVRCRGVNSKGSPWRIGIDRPIEHSIPGEEGFQFIAQLDNMSLATSGNYRKFYVKDGVKYSHTIDPTTGYPVEHNLLSVTVITEHAVFADAYATAFMVMGVENAIQFIEQHNDLNLHAYCIEDDNGEWKITLSSGFKNFILE